MLLWDRNIPERFYKYYIMSFFIKELKYNFKISSFWNIKNITKVGKFNEIRHFNRKYDQKGLIISNPGNMYYKIFSNMYMQYYLNISYIKGITMAWRTFWIKKVIKTNNFVLLNIMKLTNIYN